MLQVPTPLPKPRYAIANEFPVDVLGPYVGMSEAALEWCRTNHVGTVKALRRAMRPGRLVQLTNCPPDMVAEFLRLLDPPGIPADWPLHPDSGRRVDQQLAHVPGLYNLIRWVIGDAKDHWAAMLYLFYFEEDFKRYKGIGSTKLSMVLAWRDEMRKRHAAPAEVLGRDVLKGRAWSYTEPVMPVRPNLYASLWESVAKHAADGYIGTVRYAGRGMDGINHVCLVTQRATYTMRWPDWAYSLAKDALLSGRHLFVMARGEPLGPSLLEVHLLAE